MISLPPALARPRIIPPYHDRFGQTNVRFIGDPILAWPEHTASSRDLHDPLHGGVYVNPRGAQWIGTLSGVVTKSGVPYLLSNAHVFYTHSGCCQGKDIMEPPDVYPRARKVGVTQSRHKPGGVTFKNGTSPSSSAIQKMVTYYDAGLATCTVRYSFNIDGVGIP